MAQGKRMTVLPSAHLLCDRELHRPKFSSFYFMFCLSLTSLSMLIMGCMTDVEELEVGQNNYSGHSVSWDLEPLQESKADGLVEKFDPNWLMSDSFFKNDQALTVNALQFFFEESPYGHRSWLAEAEIGGIPAAQKIIEVAHDLNINPVLLLARMQVEQGLISVENLPRKENTDFAFGCGCPDYVGCNVAYRGLGKQLSCAGETLNKLFDQSISRVGSWRAGKAKKTLDERSITPSNHATAALYAYTPWVLRGSGGNWLAWNVTRKFTRFMKEEGLLIDLISNQEQPHREDCLYLSGRSFIGSPCACEGDCDFWQNDQKGTCHSAGFCTISCEGSCPDLSGKASTFCIEEPVSGEAGICVSKASEENGHCADLPMTYDQVKDRYIGASSAAEQASEVCSP